MTQAQPVWVSTQLWREGNKAYQQLWRGQSVMPVLSLLWGLLWWPALVSIWFCVLILEALIRMVVYMVQNREKQPKQPKSVQAKPVQPKQPKQLKQPRPPKPKWEPWANDEYSKQFGTPGNWKGPHR
jgi:hypothetical protein